MNANWYSEVPVVTRTYMTMAFMTTLACSLDIITPLSLYLNTNLIYTKYQVRQPDTGSRHRHHMYTVLTCS